MILILKQGATKKRIKIILDNLAKERKHKGVDVYKYCGKIKLKEDALEIQKGLRNEWQ